MGEQLPIKPALQVIFSKNKPVAVIMLTNNFLAMAKPAPIAEKWKKRYNKVVGQIFCTILLLTNCLC
jgi:hypothetical protein